LTNEIAIESLKVTRNVGVTTLNRQAKILEIEARKHSASTIVVKTISSSGERASLSQPGPTDSLATPPKMKFDLCFSAHLVTR
jgi:hypothetical protein